MSKDFDFGQYSWKSRFWSKLSENLDLGQHFRKISILVNIFGKKFSTNIGIGQNFGKMSIWVKICKYVDFGQKYPKISFLSKFSKISISVKIVEKSQIWSNLSKNLDFGQNCRKFSILVKH